MKEKKKKRDASDIIPGAFAIIGIGTMVTVGAWELGGPYVFGTTPAQIEALSLEGTPRSVAKGLSATDVRSDSVRARFKKSAGKPYEYFELSWTSKSANAPSQMRLVPEHEKGEDDRGADAIAALTKRFHLSDGSWSWGRVTIQARKSDGELEASVEPTWNKKPNALFDRQMDAARQVLLEAAFGIPVHASEAELAELLGTGYKTADVGKIDPATPIEDVPALMTSRFPGSLHDSPQSWRIAIDHPLFESVDLTWERRPGGQLAQVMIGRAAEAYAASRDALEACLANVLGAAQPARYGDHVFTVGSLSFTLGRRDVFLQTTSRFDAASLAKVFDALGGCRDKSENGASRADVRKK